MSRSNLELTKWRSNTIATKPNSGRIEQKTRKICRSNHTQVAGKMTVERSNRGPKGRGGMQNSNYLSSFRSNGKLLSCPGCGLPSTLVKISDFGETGKVCLTLTWRRFRLWTKTIAFTCLLLKASLGAATIRSTLSRLIRFEGHTAANFQRKEAALANCKNGENTKFGKEVNRVSAFDVELIWKASSSRVYFFCYSKPNSGCAAALFYALGLVRLPSFQKVLQVETAFRQNIRMMHFDTIECTVGVL